MNISPIDLSVFVLYCVLILFVGLYVSRKKEGHVEDANDYFWRDVVWLGGL